jgi:hypothetical protein
MLPKGRSCIVMTATFTPYEAVSMMKLGGFLLLLSGWGIVVAALTLLHGRTVSAFVYAGFAVEILGLALVFRAHLPHGEENE